MIAKQRVGVVDDFHRPAFLNFRHCCIFSWMIVFYVTPEAVTGDAGRCSPGIWMAVTIFRQGAIVKRFWPYKAAKAGLLL
jgi:hypothetical protein